MIPNTSLQLLLLVTTLKVIVFASYMLIYLLKKSDLSYQQQIWYWNPKIIIPEMVFSSLTKKLIRCHLLLQYIRVGLTPRCQKPTGP